LFIAYDCFKLKKEVMKMTIKEVEQILGLPRATVRFYEKEGLIEPK